MLITRRSRLPGPDCLSMMSGVLLKVAPLDSSQNRMTQLHEETDGPRLFGNKTGSRSQLWGASFWVFFCGSGKDVKHTRVTNPRCSLPGRPYRELQHGVDVLGTVRMGTGAQRPGDGIKGEQACL